MIYFCYFEKVKVLFCWNKILRNKLGFARCLLQNTPQDPEWAAANIWISPSGRGRGEGRFESWVCMGQRRNKITLKLGQCAHCLLTASSAPPWTLKVVRFLTGKILRVSFLEQKCFRVGSAFSVEEDACACTSCFPLYSKLEERELCMYYYSFDMNLIWERWKLIPLSAW